MTTVSNDLVHMPEKLVIELEETYRTLREQLFSLKSQQAKGLMKEFDQKFQKVSNVSKALKSKFVYNPNVSKDHEVGQYEMMTRFQADRAEVTQAFQAKQKKEQIGNVIQSINMQIDLNNKQIEYNEYIREHITSLNQVLAKYDTNN